MFFLRIRDCRKPLCYKVMLHNEKIVLYVVKRSCLKGQEAVKELRPKGVI